MSRRKRVLTVGYEKDDTISHLLPPAPPLSLDAIFLCTDVEIFRFTDLGRSGISAHHA
jgi:hypothetical protein